MKFVIIWHDKPGSVALRSTGWCFVGLGVVVLFARRVVGNRVVDSLASSESVKPAAHSAWTIGTSLLYDIAIAMGKSLFYRQLETGIDAAYDDAGRTMACNMMDASALEGVQAFIDKRPPNW